MDFVLGIAVTSIFLISIVFSMFGQGGGLLYTPTLSVPLDSRGREPARSTQA